eukprot:403334716
MIKTNLLLVLVGLLLPSSLVKCWWRNGHLLTATVAHIELSKNHPNTLQKAEAMLKGLSDYTSFEGKSPFIECATWADEIKEQGLDVQSHWHFVDDPLFADNFTKPDWYPTLYNVTWALTEFQKYLSKPHPNHNDPQIQPLFGEGFNLRLLIHYVGDIHQPLHASDRYSKDHPDGDQGGNLFMLQNFGFDDIIELHALWDSILAQFPDDPDLPLSDAALQNLMKNANMFTSDNPRDSFTDLNAPTNDWHLESSQLAKDYVYTGIVEGQKPSQEYIDIGFKVAKRQIAKGGYRLADLLVKLLGDNKLQESKFLQQSD